MRNLRDNVYVVKNFSNASIFQVQVNTFCTNSFEKTQSDVCENQVVGLQLGGYSMESSEYRHCTMHYPFTEEGHAINIPSIRKKRARLDKI